jgi:gliding motility-associated-like protein
MKKNIIFNAILLFVGCTLSAQQFETKFKVALPDSVKQAEISWVDLDNDSLLDVLVVAAGLNNNQSLLAYKNDLTKGLIWQSAFHTGMANSSYLLADADLDNDMDIILSGVLYLDSVTVLWENTGNFLFESNVITNSAGKVLKMADLDLDGIEELIISGRDNNVPFLSIYKNTGNQWLIRDSLSISATSIEVFDLDKDGDSDFFVSGRNEEDSIITSVFYNEGDFLFSEDEIRTRVDGVSSSADLDHNGYFDVVITGIDSINQSICIFLMNNGGIFRTVSDSLVVFDKAIPFAADLNSNGKCDLNLLGFNASGDTVNIIQNDRQEVDTLNHTGLRSQVFGDFDGDGDLDLLQLLKNTLGYELVGAINKTDSVNRGPGAPINALGVTIFDRLFLYWDKPLDDHTPIESITYDLTLQSALDDLIVGEYDMIHNKRLSVSHGNNGNNNFVLLQGGASAAVAFNVQAVDNAFHSARPICNGTCTPCVELDNEHINVCKNEQLSFTGGGSALWFSFSDGFLGQYDVFETKALDSDTLFSFLPGEAGCSAIKVYVIEISEKLVRETEALKYVCEGQEIELGVEPEWETAEWRSTETGFLSDADTIFYTVIKNDTVSVKLDNETGCQLQRNTILEISKPVVTLTGETFQILKGAQVQLNAEGGENYFWLPATGLNADNIANPVASPLSTTAYTVTITDSLGCTAEAKILVIVEPTAFVPNLFTPNEDGKNDDLKIYGLEPVDNFSFTVHNREGSVVYQTNNVTEVVSVGWNGAVRGNKQPSGVYYWRVKGEHLSGRRVLLNGKSSGSIVLVR